MNGFERGAVLASTLLACGVAMASGVRPRAEQAAVEPQSNPSGLPFSGQRQADIWRQGQWERAVHDGRTGWWWISGGAWYPYSEPVYPYPTPPENLAPAAPTSAPAGSPARYFCRSVDDYFPHITMCPEGWAPNR